MKINKSIISIATKILFILLISFIITIFTLLIWAKRGISVENMTVFDHQFSKVYIKWNKKLHINIFSITNLAQNSSTLAVPPLYRILKTLDHTTAEININHYIQNKYDLSLRYFKRKLKIHSKSINASATLEFSKKHIRISHLKLDAKDYHVKFSGTMTILEKNNHVEIRAHAQIDDKLEGNFFVDFKNDEIKITASSEHLPDLKFLNRFIAIAKNVKPWIFDRLQADSYQLNKLSTHFKLSNPSKILSNLTAEATLTNVIYNFQKALSPITSELAKIKYYNNDLSITLPNAKYDDYNITNTKVNLNNIQKQPKLLLSFHTKELVNPSFLKIIEHYLQKVPLKQFSGENSIDFQLALDLLTSTVDIQTDIQVKNADLLINEHPVYIYDAKVHLNNSDLIIYKSKFKSLQSLQTSFSGKINLQTLLGELKVHLSQFSTPMIKLLNDVTVHLSFQKDGLHIDTSSSHWKLFQELTFMASKHSLFLDKNKTLHVDKIHLYKPGFMNAHIQGDIALAAVVKPNTLALNVQQIRTDKDHNKAFILENPFRIEVDSLNSNHFEASRSIDFSVGQEPVSLGALSFDIGKILDLSLFDFRYKDDFQATLNVEFDQLKRLGSIDITHVNTNVSLTKPSLLILKNKNFHFDIDNTKHLTIHEADLNVSYTNEKKIHQLKFNDLSKIAALSPYLQKHKIKEGRLNLISRDFKFFTLFATINYFPIDGYINTNTDDTIFVTSTYGKGGLKTIINDSITVSMDKRIHLDIQNTNLDLRPFLKQSDDDITKEKDSSAHKEALPPIDIEAKEGYLQFTKKGKILYSKLDASLENNAVKASLSHEKGQALMVLKNNNIELYGEKFNDTFIQNLINFKGLQGGDYSFFMHGDAEKLQGGIEINDATAKGFALYNNLLGFLNTVPALVTFKSPGFNADGFKVNHGEIHFEKLKEIVNLKSIKLYGDSSNILGSGLINVKKSTIDLTVRIFLLKDMGSILSSVPIAGYLLLGEDGSLTTTLTIKGDLNDPDISVNLGTDILMAPVNIIKRTLLSPVRFYDWITGKKEKPKNGL